MLDKGEGFNYVEFDSYENVPEDKRYIKESMFCVKENELLEKTARILPQD